MGLFDHGGNHPEAVLDDEDISRLNFKEILLKKTLKLKKEYKALTFCALYEEQEEKELILEYEFINKNSFRDHYFPKTKYFRGDILHRTEQIEISRKKAHRLKFKKPLKNLSLSFDYPEYTRLLITAEYTEKYRKRFKHITKGILELEGEIEDLKVNIFIFNIDPIKLVFDVHAVLLKHQGFYIESEEIAEFSFLFLGILMVVIMIAMFVMYLSKINPNFFSMNLMEEYYMAKALQEADTSSAKIQEVRSFIQVRTPIKASSERFKKLEQTEITEVQSQYSSDNESFITLEQEIEPETWFNND